MVEKFGYYPEKKILSELSPEVMSVVRAYIARDWNMFELIVKNELRNLENKKNGEWISDLNVAENILVGKLGDNDMEHKSNVLEKMSIAVGFVRNKMKMQKKEAENIQSEDEIRSGIDFEEYQRGDFEHSQEDNQ